MNANTIKAAVRRIDETLKIAEIKKHKLGVFTVKVKKQMPRSERLGMITGDWNGGDVSLDSIDWL